VSVQVTKMHGLGNDYVYVDLRREHVADPGRLARAVSDRHRGLGSDGLILVGPADTAEADVRMRIFNADGSEAQMCGNGIRCVARLAVERGMTSANPLRVQTGRGTLAVRWRRAGEGGFEAAVGMGVPQLACETLPACVPGVAPGASVVARPLPPGFWGERGAEDGMDRGGLTGTITLVGMGNPHAVLWCRQVDEVPLERVGPFLERHAWFPQRINVHVAQVLGPSRLRMRTWERGSGITMACGTGASAVAVAAVLQGLAQSPLQVELPGGELRIDWNAVGEEVVMTGPAEFVADAVLSPELAREAG
jgi:diaminopimelate epimerase